MPSMRMSAIRQATSRGSKRERNDSRRVEALDAVVLAFEQPLQGVAHGLVVVDDVDGAFLRDQAHEISAEPVVGG